MALYIIDLPGHQDSHRIWHELNRSICNHDCLYYEQNEPMDPAQFLAEGRRGPDEPMSLERAHRREESLRKAIEDGRDWREGDEDK